MYAWEMSVPDAYFLEAVGSQDCQGLLPSFFITMNCHFTDAIHKHLDT